MAKIAKSELQANIWYGAEGKNHSKTIAEIRIR